MNLHLTGHQLPITPAIREYVAAKLERLTHHFDNVIDVNVIVSVDKLDRTILKHKEKTLSHRHDGGARKHQQD